MVLTPLQLVEVLHLGDVLRDDDFAAVAGVRAELLEHLDGVRVSGVPRPHPRAVARVVGGVDLGAFRDEHLDALAPALVRGEVQRGVSRALHLVDVLAIREELETEFHVSVHDGVVKFHRADEAAAAHAAAAVGLDADASVPLGERALHAGVPRVALDHRRCARCGWVRPERDDATWGKISFSRMMNPFGDGGYRS